MKSQIKLSNKEIRKLTDIESFEFPKYTTQLINLASQNAQATRPAVVGQMTDLIQEFSGKKLKSGKSGIWKHIQMRLKKPPKKL